MRLHLPLLVLLLIAVLILPVVAVNPPDTGLINDTQYVMFDTHDITNTVTTIGALNALWFRTIDTYTEFSSLKLYSVYDGAAGITITNPPLDTYGHQINTSSEPITFYDAVTNTYMGSGVLTYSVDNNNNIYVAVYANNWFLKGLTGNRKVNFSYTNYNPWTLATGADYDVDGSNPARITDVYMITASTGVSGVVGTAPERELDYWNAMNVQYQRTAGSSGYDTWAFTRNFQPWGATLSNITLEYYTNNSYHTALLDTSTIDLSGINVPTGQNVRLTVTNPLNNHVYTKYWIFTTTGTMDILMNKGLDSNTPLAPNEVANAQAVYNGDMGQLGKLLWIWSQGSSTSGVQNVVRIWTLNQTSGFWYNSSGTSTDVWNQSNAIALQPWFMYANTDTNWTGSLYNSITLQIFDKNGLDLGELTKKVFVGNPYQSFVRFWVYGVQGGQQSIIPGGALYVTDTTNGVITDTGEILSTGSKLNTSTIGHNYVAWVTLVNYSQKSWCFSNQFIPVCSPVDGAYANFTISTYGTSNVNFYLYPYGGTGNATITFYVTDPNGTPISGAVVHGNTGGPTGFTNGVGVISFTNLINGSFGEYSVVDNGWIPVDQKYTIYDGEYIHVILWPQAPTVTATIPTTAIPTTLQPGQPGYVGVDFKGMLLEIAMLAGAGDLTQAGLFIAVIITALLGIIFGAYLGYQGALIGIMVGFVGSTAIGFIPIWILLVIIMLCSVFLMSRWWFGAEPG